MGKRDDEILEHLVTAVRDVFDNKKNSELNRSEGWSVTRMRLEVKVNCTTSKLLRACIAELSGTYKCVGANQHQAMFSKRY